jgi:uncharacterized repeat protein (TIGR03803 family)
MKSRTMSCISAMTLLIASAASGGDGPISRAAQDHNFTVLYSFQHTRDGRNPNTTREVRDAVGNLYGITAGGGYRKCFNLRGCGVVFKLDVSGKENVLHRFHGDQEFPDGLVRDGAGNLYGITGSGGTGRGCGPQAGCGIVFKLKQKSGGRWTEETLHNFMGGYADGAYPNAILAQDEAGNLYGTTSEGGAAGCNCGIVFKLAPNGNETVLYNFAFGPNGARPAAGVIRDAEGNLYGTTYQGGASSQACPVGCGVVFRLDTAGAETVLHSFTDAPDGAYPLAALVRDQAGNLYGTTLAGGTARRCEIGCGTVFKVDVTGKESMLHRFGNRSDGAYPVAALVRDQAGNLYGTAPSGGVYHGGIVFKIDITGRESVLHSFSGGADGGRPTSGLIQDAAGDLYGATIGGTLSFGTLFRLTP